MNIALIGTGLMGNPMALRLHEFGYLKGAFNRSKEKTMNLAEKGLIIYDSIEELFEDNDAIILILSDYNAINKLILSKKLNFNGKTIIQMSTIAPEENIELNNKINQLGGKFLEAPVLGSVPQVKSGTLQIMVSGNKETFSKYYEIFKILGENIYYLGKSGKASALKLALNQLIASLTVAFSMSLGFVRENRIDVDLFMDILRKSALYAPTFDKKLPRILNGDFTNPNFPLKHLLKDVNLIIKSFNKNEINILPLNGVKNILEEGIKENLGELDYSSLYNVIHHLS